MRQDGSIVSWGLGTVNNTPPTGNDFIDIAAGYGQSLALRQDGSIVTWGRNDDYGQVSNAPTGSDFIAIAGGWRHSLALRKDGSIISWGRDDYGQVSNTPTDTDFTAIAGGYAHSLALKQDGSIVSWGWDLYGQVSNTPTDSNFTDIASGSIRGLALRQDGSIISWGNDPWGLGTVSNTPTDNDFIAIAAGSYHSLALRQDGSIVSWGLGTVNNTPPTGNDFIDIAAGYGQSLALRQDGSIVTWGRNDDYGQVSNAPTGSDFIAIAGGWRHSLALRKDGSIISWGRDDYGQVSNTPTDTDFTAIASGGLHSLALVVESPTPPVADAGGPYSIYVGDTLILDASDSTDADGDIVSFLWDLDDDGTFETDANDQAIIDVNYTELQSLGLLVDHTYNIYLKVTDSKEQYDTNDTTLTILPKPALAVSVDIKPGSCPNPLNVKSKGVLPVAVLGSEDLDVSTIDPTSIRLAGVAPIRSSYEDVAAPVFNANDCNCTEAGPDGFLDLTLKFETQEIVEAIGDVNDRELLPLTLTGVLFEDEERPIEGADCILIHGRHKSHNKADINEDGIVDMADFAILTESWLKSSIAED